MIRKRDARVGVCRARQGRLRKGREVGATEEVCQITGKREYETLRGEERDQ